VGRDLRLDAPSEITGRLKVGGRGEIFDSLRIKDVTLAFQAQTIALEDEQGKPLFVAHNAELESPDGKITGNLAVLATEPVTTPIKGDLLSFYASLTEEDRQKLIVVMGSSTTEGVPDFYIERGGSGILSFLVQAKEKLEESGLQGVQLKRLIYFYPLDLYAEFTATNFTLLPIFVNPDNYSLQEVLTPEKVAGYERSSQLGYELSPTASEEARLIREQIWSHYEELSKEVPLPEQAPLVGAGNDGGGGGGAFHAGVPEWCVEPLEKDVNLCGSGERIVSYVDENYEGPNRPEPWPAVKSYITWQPRINYCGPVAVGMIALYWDLKAHMGYCFGFDKSVTDRNEFWSGLNPYGWSPDATQLYQFLLDVGNRAYTNRWGATGNFPGTAPWNLASGALAVLNYHPYSFRYSSDWYPFSFVYTTDAFNRIKSFVQSGNPIILGYTLNISLTDLLGGGLKEAQAHYTTVFGYKIIEYPVCWNEHYALVHDGKNLGLTDIRMDWYAQDKYGWLVVKLNYGSPTALYPGRDWDRDNYGTNMPMPYCGGGFGTFSGDCNDFDNRIHPGAEPICGDRIDQDCDGRDEGVFVGRDRDGDGWFTDIAVMCPGQDPSRTSLTNAQVAFHLAFGIDCNDYNRNIHPLATEIPDNGIDDNCNGKIDEPPVFSYLRGCTLALESPTRTPWACAFFLLELLSLFGLSRWLGRKDGV
jgi:hypothetical protein